MSSFLGRAFPRIQNPLLFVVGDDADRRTGLVACLDHILHSNIKGLDLDFISCNPEEYSVPSPSPCKDDVSSVNSILKEDWIEKHALRRPSVVIFHFPFDINWSDSEWSAKEAVLQQQYVNIVSGTGQRQCVVLVLAIQPGNANKIDLNAIFAPLNTGANRPTSIKAGTTASSEALENSSYSSKGESIKNNDPTINRLRNRLQAFMGSLQVDRDSFFISNEEDLVVTTNSSPAQVPRMLLQRTLNCGSYYYKYQVDKANSRMEKRVSTILMNGNKTGHSLDDSALLAFIKAKYNFKIAHMYDIQKKPEQSIVYYRKVFESLMNVAENVDEEEKKNQTKRLMELCNFRICQRLMKQGQAMAAANQMEMLMNTWKGILDHFTISDNDTKRRCYLHYKWMVRQYIIFIDLLIVHRNRGDIRFSSSYKTSTTVSNSTPPVKGQEFSHNLSEYYLLAAEYSIKLQEIYSRMHGVTSTESQVRIAFDEVYSFEDGNTMVDAKDNMKENKDKESFGDCIFYNHLSVVIGFLNKALQEIPASHVRRKVYVISLLSDQLMTSGDFESALTNIKETLTQGKICTKKWITLAIPLLKKAMSCSIYLGRPREYLAHALILYSLASNSHLSRIEREELHRDVLSMTTSYGNTADEPSTIAKDQSPSLQSLKQYVGIPCRPEFGMAASATQPTEYILPSNYALPLSGLPDSPTKMFDIEVYFDNSQPVIVGGTIRVELAVTSLFYNKMQFERMEVNWTNDCFCTKFVHDESGNASSSGGDIAANLTFAPNSTLKFAFDVHVKQSNLHRKAPRSTNAPASPPSPSESGVQDVDDWYVYIEKINFVLRSQYSATHMNQLNSLQNSASNGTSTSTDAVKQDGSSVSDNNTHMQHHDFVFQVNMVPDEVSSTARNTQELGLPLEDMHDYVRTASGLNESTVRRHMRVMHITTPDLNIDMLYPPVPSQDGKDCDITLLTGPVQQVNVVFKYHNDDHSMMTKQKLQLRASSDSKSSTTVSSLFFHPQIDQSQYEASNDCDKDEKWLDYVEFYPVPLDVHSTTSSGQAVTEPMLIQVDRATEGDTFCVPLFLRSGLSGSVKMKFILEMDCSDDKEMLRYKPKEFEVTAKFVKSFQMSFIMDSQSELRGGMDIDSTSSPSAPPLNENKNPAISSSSVLCEDMISMTAKLSCLHALDRCVDLLAMTLIGYESIHSTLSSKNKSTKRYFDIHDKDSSGNYDMLTSWSQLMDLDAAEDGVHENDNINISMTSLREGETYSGCAVLVCHSDKRYSVYAREAQVNEDEATDDEDDSSSSSSNKGKSSERSDVFSAGVGNVEVLWRFSDPCFLRKVDLKTYDTATRGKVNKAHITTDSNAIAAFMEWLPPIKNFQKSIDKSSDSKKSKQQSMSNNAVDVCTRVSALQFSIPLIQVVDPPFDVKIDMPNEWNVTVLSPVHIRVRNKMWTPERIQVLVDTSDYFNVSGIENKSFMIEPRGEVRLKVHFEPLIMGPVPFTNILIKWNKTGGSIYKSKRVLFILPYNPPAETIEAEAEAEGEGEGERNSEMDLYSTYQRRSSIVGMETPFQTAEA